MKAIIVEGRDCVELASVECEPANVRLGPTRYYRDGLGVVRIYAADPHNVPVAEQPTGYKWFRLFPGRR